MRFSKHLTIVLKKMFEMVGAEYDESIFEKEDWYRLHEWEERDSEGFIKWLSDYLYKNKDARKEIMAVPSKDKNSCENVARMFDLSYGWVTKK
jgi:hypothetical protein